ncbi:MAG: amidohydrolase [Pseudomonadota bacterium]
MRLILSSLLLVAAGAAHADTVIEHANGYTLTSKNQLLRFSSMAFDDTGRIIAVGSAAHTRAKAARNARHVDMHGKTVIPGLIDAHGHVFSLGEQLSQLDLTTSASLAEAIKAVAEYARANPDQAWLRGAGWNQETWKLGRFPTAAELDAVVADRPVWFDRVDGHAAWANTRAMQLAGINKDTSDPEGGRIMRDATGNPTGVFVDAAQNLVTKFIPKASEAEARAMLDRALKRIAAVGLTSVHDAGIDSRQDRIYRDYADRQQLSVRVYAMIADTGDDFDRLSKHGPLKTYANDMYALRAVKLFGDGALGSRGAALLAPYSDEPGSRGLLFRKDDDLYGRMDKAMSLGYQVNVHAIGDAANRQVLNGFASLSSEGSNAGLRHRIEHAQVIAPADIPRFKVLGIVPSMQPTHATSDMNMAEQRVGPQRIKGAYAWRTFLKQGSRIACGSDFPIESPNPFFGIHAAVTRQDEASQPAGGWYPNQALTLNEALRCFTLDAAWAAHQESSLGSLEKGKWADFIVIGQDLFKVPAKDIRNLTVLATWVGGRQVFEKK